MAADSAVAQQNTRTPPFSRRGSDERIFWLRLHPDPISMIYGLEDYKPADHLGPHVHIVSTRLATRTKTISKPQKKMKSLSS